MTLGLTNAPLNFFPRFQPLSSRVHLIDMSFVIGVVEGSCFVSWLTHLVTFSSLESVANVARLCARREYAKE